MSFRLRYLLKATFLFQLNFRVLKLEEIEDSKFLTEPIAQNVAPSFLRLAKMIFSKNLDFFCF